MGLRAVVQTLDHPWLLGAFACSAGILSFIILCIYRVAFHPYAKYPGPFLAKITSWYSVYHTYKGDLHTHVWECHQKYGPYVRYAPNRLIINTEPAFKGIYGHGKNVRKSKSYLRISLVPGVHATLGTLSDEAHGKLRRIMNQGLSDSYIRTMDAEMQTVATTFANGLGEAEDRFSTEKRGPGGDGWTAPKNMGEWCDFFTFDVMSQLVFGTSYHLLTNAENHWIMAGVSGQMRRVSFLQQLPELEDMKLHKLLFPDARRKAFRFSQKSRQIFEARQQKDLAGGKAGDLFSKLLKAKDPETGEGLSQMQLWAESNLLIIAGSDTASTAMAAVFFYLCRHPGAYRRVTEEVRREFPDPTEISQGPRLLSCAYLRACIQEALRLVPSAGGPMWREALPGGLSVPGSDIHVPAGLDVATGIWSLNHSAEYFPDPLAYRPERWIAAEAGEEAVARARAAFATFSHGPRNCVGKGLAMIEISLAMAAVIARYDFRSAGGELGKVGQGKGVLEDHYETFWCFTSMKDGPYVEFKSIHKE